MRKTALAAVAAGLAVLAGLSGPAPAGAGDGGPLPAAQDGVRMLNNVQVRMSDGVLLSTDIYLPDAPGPFPAVLARTPYGNNGADSVEQGKWYARRGYAFVTQDVRGKYDSGGSYTPFRDEAGDGHDTVEWIGAQPWCDGKVGMTGGSYGGYAQIAAATRRSRRLAALAASVTTSDVANNWIYVDGALFLSFAVGWGAVDMDGRVMQHGPAYDWPAVYRHLPLATIDEAAGRVNPAFRDWLAHPRADDPFWRGVSLEREAAGIDAPLLVVSGWYDIFLRGALRDDVAIRAAGGPGAARGRKRLLVGPWSHSTGGRDNNPRLPATGPGRSIDFGPDAEMGLRQLYLSWFDRWLKGIDNGADREAPVRIFVMGENRWRDENEWPLARTRYTKYYFGSGGKANGLAGDGTLSAGPPRDGAEADRFVYDPRDPVPTLGGNLLDCLGCNSVASGPVNQIEAELRGDVLVYTAAVQAEPLEVTGPITVKLFAASSARDTDWTAKLVDVHPDGYAQNIQDGIVRARYRRGKEAPAELLEPGRVYEYDIDLWATSHVFLPGHSVRVEVSSSNFPRFDRNLNTGEDPMTGTRMETARQTVYHSAKRPSHIVLPVIPREATNR
ncbi:MAG TPA: CocE/NonD family hydrolase [Candidatus Aminicenantes bacterium]|nr:CocE/NonD family hydrolase [Candidatus Aminicenantes bacterium]